MTATIVALSSGAPPSGVAVIRLSGPQTRAVVEALSGPLPSPRRLSLRSLTVGPEIIDTGLVAWFPGPHSFTGEDSAELQVHGSPAVVRALLRALTRVEVVRLAEAGEFTRRAFENGRLDLTEVEGLGDLIAAETEAQRRQAVLRAGGALGRAAGRWRDMLLDLRAEIEAQLDFSDEGDVGALPPDFGARVGELRAQIAREAEGAERGRIVREGLRVALAGPPNAGKSSLLNALARSDIAIVSDEAGTTRDVREVPLNLGGYLVTLVDMAGLREADSKAEREGVRRAEVQIAEADLVLWLMAPDLQVALPPQTKAPVWRVATKSDLGTLPADLAISAQTGAGLDALLARLSAFAEQAGGHLPALVSHARDVAALSQAVEALAAAESGLSDAELVAEDLRSASAALERLLGRIDAEAVLDRLFLSFCIGK